MDAAAPGAIVAIAEGTYAGDLVVGGKAVRLWGRCPSLVSIEGVDTVGATIEVGCRTEHLHFFDHHSGTALR